MTLAGSPGEQGEQGAAHEESNWQEQCRQPAHQLPGIGRFALADGTSWTDAVAAERTAQALPSLSPSERPLTGDARD